MKIPIKPRIEELEGGILHITLYFPSWSVKNLLRWIFKGEAVYDQWWECKYKPKFYQRYIKER